VNEADEQRPDGRLATLETLRLRRATRALRVHLDKLPIEHSLDVPGDRFAWPSCSAVSATPVLPEETDSTCGNLSRWLMPLPDIADLTGQSVDWLDAPSPPNEDELLDEFLARRGDEPLTGDAAEHAELQRTTRALLDMSGLRGAVMVLAHAGQGTI
jgi:hypothetical protein